MATKQKEKKPLHLAKMNIKKGDTVLIIAGKDKGKDGVVSRAMPQVSKVIVEGHNIVKKHIRPQGQTRQGGVIEKAMFGGLAFLIAGNMSVSAICQGCLLLRCDPVATDALLAKLTDAYRAARVARAAAQRAHKARARLARRSARMAP